MKIIQVSADYFKNEHIELAVSLLRNGEVISFPTDTLYGLGADLTNEKAIDKLYEIKNRPEEMPLILLGSAKEMLIPYVEEWSPLADRLSDKYWPGGLTLVMKRSSVVPDFVVSGFATVGIRVPNNPILMKILEAYGKPLATSSANLSGQPSPCTGRNVAEQLMETELAVLFDAGKIPDCNHSTLVNLSEEIPLVLREGTITTEQLEEDFAVEK